MTSDYFRKLRVSLRDMLRQNRIRAAAPFSCESGPRKCTVRNFLYKILTLLPLFNIMGLRLTEFADETQSFTVRCTLMMYVGIQDSKFYDTEKLGIWVISLKC